MRSRHIHQQHQLGIGVEDDRARCRTAHGDQRHDFGPYRLEFTRNESPTERFQQNARRQRNGECKRGCRRVLWDGKQIGQPVGDTETLREERSTLLLSRSSQTSAEALGQFDLVEEFLVPGEALLERGQLARRQGALQIAIDDEMPLYVFPIHQPFRTPLFTACAFACKSHIAQSSPDGMKSATSADSSSNFLNRFLARNSTRLKCRLLRSSSLQISCLVWS